MARALLDGLLNKVLDKTRIREGQYTVRMDEKSWEMGFTAGLTGQSTQEPSGVDGLSFISGYIEGQADRTTRRVNANNATEKTQPKS